MSGRNEEDFSANFKQTLCALCSLGGILSAFLQNCVDKYLLKVSNQKTSFTFMYVLIVSL